MALQPGQLLGPHEILAPIGAGGMGEVYRARDTRLNRTVAIKVLPEHAGNELRQRFEREAQTIAGLNHQHICTLYDVGHQDGVDFLIMEYLEGESFADSLTRGPLPLEEALKHPIEIADALDKAHRQGVIHRDPVHYSFNDYAASPDSQRFLIPREKSLLTEEGGSAPINVVLNWPELMNRK